MNRDWRDFKSINGNLAGAREAFENACETLFRKIYPNVHVSQVSVKQGDGGIDIFIGEIGVESITVIQCKFFLEAFEESQKSQIRESFDTAITSTEYELKEWILCIPRVFDINQSSWWSAWKNKKIKEHNKSLDFISLKNGNELIDLMKEHDIYNQTFNIEDSLKIDDIHKKINILNDRFLIKKIAVGEVSPNIVIFNNYNSINEPYYQERPEDACFIETLKISNLWIFGGSGKGKTALINRNLIKHEMEYLFCDLSPVTINESKDIFDEIICSLEDKFSVTGCDKENNYIKKICKLIKSCNLKKDIVIVVDELSISDLEILKEVFTSFVKLVTYHNNSSDSSALRFIISTIAEPCAILENNKAKASDFFEYMSCDNWGNYLSYLFDIIDSALALDINEQDKNYILSKSENTPRILKNIFRKIIASKDKSSESIRKSTLLTLEEYF